MVKARQAFERWLLPLMACAGVSVLVSRVVARREHQHSLRTELSEPEKGDVGDSVPYPTADKERMALATAVTALAAASSTSRAGESPAPPRHPSAEDREKELQKEVERHDELIAAHRRELRDSIWAAKMEGTIESQIHNFAGSVPEGQFQSVECRSTTCVASFSWPSRSDAQSELRTTLERIGPVPCATAITLPEANAGTGDATYRADVYLDCGTATK